MIKSFPVPWYLQNGSFFNLRYVKTKYGLNGYITKDKDKANDNIEDLIAYKKLN